MASGTTSTPGLPILQRDHRSVRGTIAYLSHKPDRYLQERGREYFMINVHWYGSRTCIAHCESVGDYVSRKVLADILESEEEHIDWLETQLALIERVGEQNYLQSKMGS